VSVDVSRAPRPLADRQSAWVEVHAAEDACNTCGPDRVGKTDTWDRLWRSRNKPRDFGTNGVVCHREAGISDVPIEECECRSSGPRADVERARAVSLG
jgi:nuclear transport factor 2 (NTF2) superfamily protein